MKTSCHKKNKVVLIGLDAATFDVIMPLINQGYLPNIKRLIENGVHADLISTIPPITAPAWLALATGLNPGKTGIIDFINRKDAEWQLKPTSSQDFRGRAFWDYLSTEGFKVGVFNYPMLFPPYPIEGFMVSGVGASMNTEITYPRSLKRELNDITNGYEIEIGYHLEKYNDEDLFLKDAYQYLSEQKKVFSYLLNKQSLDVFIGIISLSDWIQHRLWKHWDNSHPLYDLKRSPKYKEEFISLWNKIDELVGDIVKITAGADIFIVSDHGFGSHDQCFNLARWLTEQEYMVTHKTYKKDVKNTLYKIMKKTKLLMPDSFSKLGMGKRLLTSVKTSIIDSIDFEASKAFCLGHTIPFGGIYINKNKNSAHYSNTRNEIAKKLSNLNRQLNRNDISVEIFLPEKIFTGHMLEHLPDIIFTINNWRCIIEENNINNPLFMDKPYSPRHTGTHRLNGIFIASGPHIRNVDKKLADADIYDIFPTILYLMGYPISENDGKILYKIFKEEIKPTCKEYKKLAIDNPSSEINTEEAEEIKEKLKGLGYL